MFHFFVFVLTFEPEHENLMLLSLFLVFLLLLSNWVNFNAALLF
jgi:hypothetical protein